MSETRIISAEGGSNVEPTILAIDRTFKAARMSQRPLEYTTPSTTLGHYKLGFTFSHAANIGVTPLVTLRWTDANALFVLHRIRWLAANLTTAFTTQQLVDVAATIARSFTAADTGGSASIIPAAGMNKGRTSMGNTLVGQLVTGSTAIAAGTRTLDGNPFGYACADIASNTAATGGTPLITNPKDIYVHVPGQEHPPVLAQNEGIIINCPNSLAAVGVVKWGFVIEWAEVLVF